LDEELPIEGIMFGIDFGLPGGLSVLVSFLSWNFWISAGVCRSGSLVAVIDFCTDSGGTSALSGKSVLVIS